MRIFLFPATFSILNRAHVDAQLNSIGNSSEWIEKSFHVGKKPIETQILTALDWVAKIEHKISGIRAERFSSRSELNRKRILNDFI